MAQIGKEFEEKLKLTFDRKVEDRNFITFSFAQRTLLNVVQQRYQSHHHQEMAMTKYTPLADWLAKPKSFEEFRELKSNFYGLTCHLVKKRLFGDLEMRLSLNTNEHEWE